MKNLFDAGNGYVKGVVEEPDNFQIMEKILKVENQVDVIAKQMQQNDSNFMNNDGRRIVCKKRRKCVRNQMTTEQDGTISLIQTYDDASKDVVPFFTNIRGRISVYRIEIKEHFTTDFFGIYVDISSKWIIGRISKVKQRYLYECFIKSGVIISSNITCSKASQVLFETFAAEIISTENRCVISMLAGWYNGEFYSAEKFPFAKVGEFLSLPVMKREFPVVKPDRGVWSCYFNEINKIVNTEDRLMILLLPYISILKSLMREEHCECFVSLNFVKTNDFQIEKICSWFQIFNRKKFSTVYALSAEKEWIKYLCSCKDEIVIANFSISDSDSQYEKSKIIKRWKKTLDITEGKMGSMGNGENGEDVTLITISSDLITGGYNSPMLAS